MSPRVRSILAAALACTLAPSCRSAGTSPREHAAVPAGGVEDGRERAGLLVMAHGGSAVWDRAVGAAVDPLRDVLPTALAVGMADPNTLQAAVDSLEAEGVTRIAVVRLFLSGASFLDQTEFLLGLRAEPPAQVMLHGGAGQGGHGGHLAPLAHRARFLLGREGLSSASMVPTILAERAGAAAPAADRPVLVLAHGMGDEDENRALLGDMERTADAIRSLGFREVRSATLREDWPEERVRAEADIRRWAASVVAPGREVVVVPYRLFGFGPYAEVLAGLPHCGTEGIVPHPLVTRWIREQATALLCADVERGPAEGCPNSGAPRG